MYVHLTHVASSEFTYPVLNRLRLIDRGHQTYNIHCPDAYGIVDGNTGQSGDKTALIRSGMPKAPYQLGSPRSPVRPKCSSQILLRTSFPRERPAEPSPTATGVRSGRAHQTYNINCPDAYGIADGETGQSGDKTA